MWYAANIFMQSHSEATDSNGLWEESIVLVDAESEAEAIDIAEIEGRSKESQYANADNRNVSWKFVKVERVCAIEATTLTSGIELFSRFLRNEEAMSLLSPATK